MSMPIATVDLSGARWRKSSRSLAGGNSDCVEVAQVAAARWRKSSRSVVGGNSDCVEVAFVGPAAAVRDSKNAAGPVLLIPAGAWEHFLTS